MVLSGVKSVLKTQARRGYRVLKRVLDEPASATTGRASELTPFLCNVCGTVNLLPRPRLTREDGHCSTCRCYGRLRSMMYAVTAEFSPNQPVLAWMAARKEVRGVGCSDWGYVELLAEKFDYVNTFYDHEPRLDLCNIDESRWKPGSIDFITCTDVLEHVEPPLHRAFAGMHRLLKPGGVAIITVPTTLETANREHFPELHDWKIAEEGGRRTLVNRRLDGTEDRFRDLCFHGGEGMTLEFRFFSRQGLIESVESAGLKVARIYDRDVSSFAVPLCESNFVLVARK